MIISTSQIPSLPNTVPYTWTDSYKADFVKDFLIINLSLEYTWMI